MAKVLLVDDENQFRESLVRRLQMRNLDSLDVSNGEDAIRAIRAHNDIDVMVLDLKMPGMCGDQVLREVREFRPELQVVILTGHGSLQSAMELGKLEAYAYVEKPCDFDELLTVIESARADKVYAHARHEVPNVEKGSIWKWLKGSHNSRPIMILTGVALFLAMLLSPAPGRLLTLLSAEKTGAITVDEIAGYSSYGSLRDGETIADYYSRTTGMGGRVVGEDGKKTPVSLPPESVAAKAEVMLGILIVAALFWASGAVPVGVTALLVGVLMYFFGVLKPDDIAGAYAKDSVIFIFGVLAMAHAISKTGLDRRIGLLLLGPSRSVRKLLFLFLPMLGITCSFISEHALVAFLTPLFMMVYVSSVRSSGLRKDKALIVMLLLSMTFAANCGGPGSPAAGGRNAVMLGILSEYDMAPTFLEWVMYGLPFVPVMCLVIALYFLLALGRKVQVQNLNVSSLVREAADKIGPMNRQEYIAAGVLGLVVVLWITASDKFGMGGPVILGLVLLNVFRVMRWRDMASIPWDVVALYASASALGKGLAVTGAALYMADTFVGLMPDFMSSGEGLAIAASLFTGIITNFMSDGAAVSAIGPITIPMATITSTPALMVGFATAFSSSFAHMMIIGTPNNAIVYAMAKDPVTGEQLVTLGDFFKHGAAVLVLSFAVLWLWVFFGYWQIIGF